MNVFSRFIFGIAAWAILVTVVDGADQESGPAKMYSVSAQIRSFVPGDSLITFRDSGSGSASVGGRVSLGAFFDGKNHFIEFTPRQREGVLLVGVEMRADDLESKELEIDLSDMKPKTIDVGEAKDGRRFHMTFTPHIQTIDATAKSLTEEAALFSNWQFREAPVIVNDALYVGRLGGGGDIVNFEISDIGSIEITLREMEGWQPWGTLKDGIVTIIRPVDRTGIEILNAQNGPSNAPLTLPGGPYRVWVRWEDAMPSEEVWKQWRVGREEMIANGLDPNDIRVLYIDKQLAREPSPWIFNSGFRDLKRSRP